MQSYVPSLEPRDTLPRPKKHWVRQIADLLLACGVIRFLFAILDLFGRGESAVELYKFFPKVILFFDHLAFSFVAIVLGFLLLIYYGKYSNVASQSLILHPVTKLPYEYPGFPWMATIWRAVAVVLVASLVALVGWLCLLGPFARFFFVQAMAVVPPPPKPPHLMYVSSNASRKEEPHLLRTDKPFPAPQPVSQQTSALGVPPPNLPAYQPPPKPELDQAAVCPPLGVLAGGWRGSSSPIGQTFSYTFDQRVAQSLHPYLSKSLTPTTKGLKASQLIGLITLFDELEPLVPAAEPVKINQKVLTQEVVLRSIERSFQTRDHLTLQYSVQVPAVEQLTTKDINVPISSLKEDQMNEILQLDQLARSKADAACKDELDRLTKQQ